TIADNKIIPLGTSQATGGAESTVTGWNNITGKPFSTLEATHFNVVSDELQLANPFNPSGNYSGLRARATTAADVGLGDVPNWSVQNFDNRYYQSGDNATLGSLNLSGAITQYQHNQNNIDSTAYSDVSFHRTEVKAQRARGTQSSPFAVLSDDWLGQFSAFGYDGNSFER